MSCIYNGWNWSNSLFTAVVRDGASPLITTELMAGDDGLVDAAEELPAGHGQPAAAAADPLAGAVPDAGERDVGAALVRSGPVPAQPDGRRPLRPPQPQPR